MNLSPSFEEDPTLKRAFKEEHTGRLLAWECLQRAITCNTAELTDEEVADRLGASDGYCYNAVLSCKRRLTPHGNQSR